MGTDIHFLVQTQTDGGWKNIWPICSRKEFMRKYPWTSGRHLPEWVCDPFYTTRNYDVFGMLANVRNPDGFDPLVEQRGLPADLMQIEDGYGEQGLIYPDFPEGCTDALGRRSEFSLGEHSFSWVTLAELVEYFEVYPEYREAAGDFYDSTLPALINVATQQGLKYDQVRCVFGFDS